MDWSAYPFVRITMAFIMGVMAKGLICGLEFSLTYLTLLLLLFFIIYLVFLSNRLSINYHFWISLTGFGSFIILGLAFALMTEMISRPGYSHDDLQSTTCYTATIKSKPSFTETSARYQVIIDRRKSRDGWQRCHDRAIIYFADDTIGNLSFGDQVLITGHPEFTRSQTNPHAFDYSTYLARKGIYLQDYIRDQEMITLVKEKERSLKSISIGAGDKLEGILSTFLVGEREILLAKAMLLGRREEISPEMQFAYQATGTTHILAVSGLHVGIIYLLFSFLLRHLKVLSKWVYFFIILGSIWCFAFITGLSPSVQRSAFMLSIVLMAQMLSRRSNIYNSILVSAYIMLMISPNLIYSVSFQLSYLAVLGIVFLFKEIYGLLYFQNKVVDFFWKITSVSISVQIATFPVVIYYFNQFPLLSLVTNLVAIPTATIVLSGGIALLATSFVPIVPNIVGGFLSHWIYYYNELMLLISRYSFAAWQNIHMRPHFVFAILALVVLIKVFLSNRKLLVLQLITLLLVLCAMVRVLEAYRLSNQQQLVFYDVRGRLYYDVFEGLTCYTNATAATERQQKDVSYSLLPNRNFHRISTIRSIDEYRRCEKIGINRLLRIGQKTILILIEPDRLRHLLPGIEVDYLVVDGATYRERGEDLYLEYETMIITGFKAAGRSTNQAALLEKHRNVHLIAAEGAYVIDI